MGNLIRINFWRALDDESDFVAVPDKEVPAWIKQDGIINMMLKGDACLDKDTGYWYGATKTAEQPVIQLATVNGRNILN